ncbi:Ni/Fe-hydrogenase, b-type cytochrome subunit [Paraferrimonas sedimenticola]|uniref:Ni/Fe-hydrogenase, b-type cytochrome subunit n=1 Tax=Paraferrimonas sedimenticola TaxID=375674 RepID=A0AA37RVF2_9GAMM|nr:Ni/Fe-hydrogenase, b-type cytochrome subunit [Paraferrimonas sedimenticola]GLP95609.1 Ni/Fe-hydrogenase, b-type cytochrome subunit [Paraferrimonas sedimenticola]
MQHAIPHSRDKIFSPVIRICHWLRFAAIILLLVTGFYIAWPFLTAYGGSDNLIQGWVRFAHLISGFVLIAVTLARAYLYFFSRSDIERRSVKDVVNPKSWITQIKSYMWIGKLNKAGVYGPLQFVTYFGLTLVIVFMCLSGLALHANVYHEGLGGIAWTINEWMLVWMGSLAAVREWHHIASWVFIIFILVHVYMAVWTGIRFKHNSVDSIVSGYDYHPMKRD